MDDRHEQRAHHAGPDPDGHVSEMKALLAEELAIDPSTAAVEVLAGGVSSVVVRISYDGGCLVLKQALSRLRVDAAWHARPERSLVEARCGVALDRLVPGSVPRILRVLPRRHAVVMACAPPGARTWKSELMAGRVDLATAAAVGRLLAEIHTRSAPSPALAREFADRSFFEELRIEPFFLQAVALHPGLRHRIDEELVTALQQPGSCLVHGDFSPKNLLVTEPSHVMLIDHEVAHWGHPAFDVAFVLAHLALKAIHFRSPAYVEAAEALLATYRDASSLADAAAGELGGALMAGVLLARVDGKSPVEYLVGEERDIVRDLAAGALTEVHDPTSLLGLVRRSAGA